jgi:N-acetylglucosaminyldiphosphoundecaprenol N-acetyl-beta-D-mannosaminyltransferase
MRQKVLGVEVDSITLIEALARVKDRLDKGSQGYIVTPNPEIVVLAHQNEEYRKILNKSFLSIPDGFGLIVAGMLANRKFPERMAGVDFVYELAALAAEHHYKLFFLGGFGEVA